MNPSVNPSSDSPQLTAQPTEPLNPSIPEVTIDSPTEADVMSADTPRQQPIPPPSEPMQYRAIGLIRGKYQPSEEQLTRGNLLAADGTAIDAVLLGRVMSLVKNHLDLQQSHLWVVYPRTRQEDGNLHVQIVGVWEPERLTDKVEVPDDGDIPETDNETTTANDGYFSIRGEVVFHSQEQEQAIIKIKQAPRRESEKEKFFKLTLKGVLAERSLGRFWDLQVQLQGNTLQIKEAKEIGVLPLKKRPPGSRPAPGGRRDGRRPPTNQRPPFRSDQARAGGGVSRPPTPKPAIRKEPIPKPIIKRQEKNQ